MKLVFGDHQWRRNTDGGPVCVLGKYMPPRQRLADIPTRAEAGIDCSTPAYNPRERTAITP